jgi:hypothetical protein
MRHGRQVRRSWRRLPGTLGAAVLSAGVMAAGLPAGTALASPGPATTAAPPQYSLDMLTHVTALGHVWTLDLAAGGGRIQVSLGTAYGGVSELHMWSTTGAFAATVAKDLKVTSTGHATLNTGSALNPVLGMSLSFSPVKVAKAACKQGSDSTYSGKVTGTLSLVTGLRGVKFNVKFSGQAAGVLDVDRGCVTPAGKTPCTGSYWGISQAGWMSGVGGFQTLGSKPAWAENFSQEGLKTASKWVTRTVAVSVNGPAPKLNTTAKTFSVSGLPSGAITGAAVISYSNPLTSPPVTCYLGAKKYKETGIEYAGLAPKVIKPFQAHSLLAGTMKMSAFYVGVYTYQKLSPA